MTSPGSDHGEAAAIDPPWRKIAAKVLLQAYRYGASPLLHSLGMTQCKFLPTCSEYAYVAVVRHGWLRGSWLALRRLTRCRPFSPGGADPVP